MRGERRLMRCSFALHCLVGSVGVTAGVGTACAPRTVPPAVSSPGSSSTPVRASPYDTMPPDLQAARGLVGCYWLTVGPWSSQQGFTSEIAIPSRLVLDTARHPRPTSGFGLVARALGSDSARRTPWPPAWAPVGADSLQVRAWANQTADVTLFLHRRAKGTLQGIARYFWDQIAVDPVTKRWLWEQYPMAPATLRPAPCG
jgi:hypothetical protein